MGWRGGWRNRKEQEKLEVSPQGGEGRLSQSLQNGTPGELGVSNFTQRGLSLLPNPPTIVGDELSTPRESMPMLRKAGCQLRHLESTPHLNSVHYGGVLCTGFRALERVIKM